MLSKWLQHLFPPHHQTSCCLEELESRCLLNGAAATLSGIDDLQNLPAPEFPLTGWGITIDMWERAHPYIDHPEFADPSGLTPARLAFGEAEQTVAATLSRPGVSHASHVAGTLIGLGRAPQNLQRFGSTRGMAPNARLRSWDRLNWAQEMQAVGRENAFVLSNHSWGRNCGFEQAQGQWVWFGDAALVPTGAPVEDYKFGWYGPDARQFDNILFRHPHHTAVLAAGNDGADAPPVGAEYLDLSTKTIAVYEASSQQPIPDGAAAFDTLAYLSTAKNPIVVGSVDDPNDGIVAVSDFSATGPTDDGRIKPDLVANGRTVHSAGFVTIDAPGWTFSSGTSSSTAVVTGGLALLQSYYHSLHADGPAEAERWMSAALAKALLCHTAADDHRPGPNYDTGWGLFDAHAAYRIIKADHDPTDGLDEMQQLRLAAGETIEIAVLTTTDQPVKATIAWTDPPADTAPRQLDNPQSRLVNDIDLLVRGDDGISIHRAWTLDPDAPERPPTQEGNHRDNVEQVAFTPSRSALHTVVITATQLATETQDVALILQSVRRH